MGWNNQPGLLERTHFTVSPLSPEDSWWTSVLNFNWADISFGCNTLPETVCSALKINIGWKMKCRFGARPISVDGWIPAPPRTYKRPCSLNNGINYQPQLVNAGCLPSTVSFNRVGLSHHRPHPAPYIEAGSKDSKDLFGEWQTQPHEPTKGWLFTLKWAADEFMFCSLDIQILNIYLPRMMFWICVCKSK